MSNIKLDGSMGIFTVNDIGSVSKETFMGTFEVKCVLNPLDQIKADKLYRELLGAINPHLASVDVQNLVFALSQLKYRVQKSPAGWRHSEIDGGHLDANIVLNVLNQSIKCQVMYNEQANKRIEELQQKLTEQVKSGELDPKQEGEL